MAWQPFWADVSSLLKWRDHPQTHHTRQDSSGRVVDPSQGSLPDNQQPLTTDRHPSLSVGFEPAIPADDRPRNGAWDPCAAVIDFLHAYNSLFNNDLSSESIKSCGRVTIACNEAINKDVCNVSHFFPMTEFFGHSFSSPFCKSDSLTVNSVYMAILS